MVLRKNLCCGCISAVAAGLLTACVAGVTETPSAIPAVHIISGSAVTDTINKTLARQLVVEVRDSNGHLAPGRIVRFEAQRATTSVSVCALATTIGCAETDSVAVDTTDVQGLATATVTFGRIAGLASVRVVVPVFGIVDSAVFTINPGAAFGVQVPTADTSLDIGGTVTLRSRVVDRYNNARVEVPALSLGSGGAITVDATTALVTARDMGTQWLVARYTSFADSTRVRVIPSGRLAVWSPFLRAIRLLDLNGRNVRTIANAINSELGAFPHFDTSRQRVTTFTQGYDYSTTPNTVVIADTTGEQRRNIGPGAAGFSTLIAVRQLADRSVLTVGQRLPGGSFALWRIATDNTLTQVAELPGQEWSYGGADISYDGTRVAYLARAELRVLTIATGAITVIETNARGPRWSAQGDRLAYLVPSDGTFTNVLGTLFINNANGTARRALGTNVYVPGLTWSPDGIYIVAVSQTAQMRVLRVNDGMEVLLKFPVFENFASDYVQPDWR